MAEALALLREEAARTSAAEAARRIGYSRPAVSMALAGTYKGGLGRLADAVLATLGGVACPHLGRTITPRDCADFAGRPMPTASRAAVAHWRACRACPHRPCPHRPEGGSSC
ncbi:LacI family transcriptional regulator [Azospirillum sp. RWY-5-1]|uniref:LacI family transcriptional regulator n=1 Tax=Azospirillum oleiclasticum TaxID=2735135 RepID=A0ABX2TJV8_9PROT|nr:LacI family transcriptional regulator [Azospirillum oleiclasticum]NYZ24526.1 LacI family transcriptional regulator [Azospirillum oleiclasticum]